MTLPVVPWVHLVIHDMWKSSFRTRNDPYTVFFSELYEIFVEISRVKFHVLLTYNYDDKEAKRLLRMHKSILCASTQINLKVTHYT